MKSLGSELLVSMWVAMEKKQHRVGHRYCPSRMRTHIGLLLSLHVFALLELLDAALASDLSQWLILSWYRRVWWAVAGRRVGDGFSCPASFLCGGFLRVFSWWNSEMYAPVLAAGGIRSTTTTFSTTSAKYNTTSATPPDDGPVSRQWSSLSSSQLAKMANDKCLLEFLDT